MSEHQTVESGNATPKEGERTFTQSELDTIINKRLTEERRKTEAAIAEREREITAREHRLVTADTMRKKNLPEYLLEALNTGDAETLNKSIELIDRFLKEQRAQIANELMKPGSIPKAGGLQPPHKDAIRQGMGL